MTHDTSTSETSTSETSTSETSTSAAGPAERVRLATTAPVHVPGELEYHAATTAWNLAVDQRPAAAAFPRDTAELAEVVRAAAAAGLRVAPQATGHGAAPLKGLADAVLLRTTRMTGARVVEAGGELRVRVRAGTAWREVVTAAARAGRVVLHGTCGDTGAVGDALGGGLGWYARRHGLAASSVTAADVVLADGSVVRTDEAHRPELLWALRGAGANLGVVTELELRTFPAPGITAGLLVWDASRMRELLVAWSAWARTAPESVTTTFRRLQLPDVAEVPQRFRDRDLVVVSGAVLGEDEVRTGALLAPLRALAPEEDTFGPVGPEALLDLHGEPDLPTAVVGRSVVLHDLPDDAIDALLAVGGPSSPTAPPFVELRQLGGALGRPDPRGGALRSVEGAYVLVTGARADDAATAVWGRWATDRVAAAVRPWGTGRPLLAFTDRPTDTASAFWPAAADRLRRLRQEVDPTGVLVAHHRL